MNKDKNYYLQITTICTSMRSTKKTIVKTYPTFLKKYFFSIYHRGAQPKPSLKCTKHATNIQGQFTLCATKLGTIFSRFSLKEKAVFELRVLFQRESFFQLRVLFQRESFVEKSLSSPFLRASFFQLRNLSHRESFFQFRIFSLKESLFN